MSMSHTAAAAPKMKINRRASARLRVPRIVRLSTIETDQASEATRAADKMVAAGRENIRFLTRHLKPFERFLQLTPDIDNVLYLAYSITVRDDAPFTADDMRRHLAKAGIETRPVFGFVHDPEAYRLKPLANRRPSSPDRTFCLACHQYLTILDLQHVVETCESFFSGFAGGGN